MTTSSRDIADRIVDRFNAARKERGYREMSAREADRLTATTQWLVETARDYKGARDEQFEIKFIDEVQTYVRDEWYGLRTQIEYLQILRSEMLASVAPGQRATVGGFYDNLIILAVEACRRPDRYEWPTLVLVGFGHLAQTKLVEPIKALVPHNPIEVFVVDRNKKAVSKAKKAFSKTDVHVKSADKISEALSLVTNPKIVYIATESASHLAAVNEYLQYKGVRVIAVEKPLTTKREELQVFRELAAQRDTPRLVVVDHYVFRRSALMVERVKRVYPELFNAIADQPTRLEFVMEEKAAFDVERGASSEGVILDMLPHLFPFITMLLTTDLSKLEIVDVKGWRYKDAKGPAETAALVHMRVGKTDVIARAGKAMPANRKSATLTGTRGKLLLDLSTGSVSIQRGSDTFALGTPAKDVGYGYVLYNLVTAAALEFQSVATASTIVEILLDLRDRAQAQECGTYARGKSPF